MLMELACASMWALQAAGRLQLQLGHGKAGHPAALIYSRQHSHLNGEYRGGPYMRTWNNPTPSTPAPSLAENASQPRAMLGYTPDDTTKGFKSQQQQNLHATATSLCPHPANSTPSLLGSTHPHTQATSHQPLSSSQGRHDKRKKPCHGFIQRWHGMCLWGGDLRMSDACSLSISLIIRQSWHGRSLDTVDMLQNGLQVAGAAGFERTRCRWPLTAPLAHAHLWCPLACTFPRLQHQPRQRP